MKNIHVYGEILKVPNWANWLCVNKHGWCKYFYNKPKLVEGVWTTGEDLDDQGSLGKIKYEDYKNSLIRVNM